MPGSSFQPQQASVPTKHRGLSSVGPASAGSQRQRFLPAPVPLLCAYCKGQQQQTLVGYRPACNHGPQNLTSASSSLAALVGRRWRGAAVAGVRRHVMASKAHDSTATKSKRWSQAVTGTSDALDLEAGVFALKNPREIARSLKRSADQSQRRKSEPFRSAMSMLTFYINRAGRHLSAVQRDRLEEAKDELRVLYGRPRQKPQHRK